MEEHTLDNAAAQTTNLSIINKDPNTAGHRKCIPLRGVKGFSAPAEETMEGKSLVLRLPYGSRRVLSQTTLARIWAVTDLPNLIQNPPLITTHVQTLHTQGWCTPWLHVIWDQMGQAAVPVWHQDLAAGNAHSFCCFPLLTPFKCKGALTAFIPQGFCSSLSCPWGIMTWF